MYKGKGGNKMDQNTNNRISIEERVETIKQGGSEKYHEKNQRTRENICSRSFAVTI